jgi:Arc/MetJ family transcription regulator
MKTLVDIDDRLLARARKLSHAATKKETIHRALEELVRASRRQALKAKAGTGIVDLTLGSLRRSRRERFHRLERLAQGGR